MKKKMLVAPMLTAVTLAFSGAFAQGPPPGLPHGQPPGTQRELPAPIPRPASVCVAFALSVPSVRILDWFASRLELRDEQLAKLTTLLKSAPSKLDPLRRKADDALVVLRKGIFDPGTDALSIKEIADKAQKAEAAIASAELEMWIQVRKILTPDQLKKLGKMMAAPRSGDNPPPGPPPVPRYPDSVEPPSPSAPAEG